MTSRAILFAGVTAVAGLKASAMDRVIGMIQKLMKETTAELAQMEINFAAGTQNCASEQTSLSASIQRQSEIIDSETSNAQGQKLEQDADLKAAQDARTDHDSKEQKKREQVAGLKKHNKEYAAEIDSRTSTILAIKNAHDHIKKNTQRQPASLIELSQNSAIASSARSEMQAWLNQPQGTSSGYEGSSGGILGLLNKLHGKFREEMETYKTAQSNAKNARLTEIQTLGNGMEAATTEATSRKAQAGKHGKRSADAATKATNAGLRKTADSKALSEKKAYCMKMTREHMGNKKMMTEEVQVSGQVIDILNGGAKDNFESSGSGSDRVGRASLLQILSSSNMIGNKNEFVNVLEMLKGAAQKTHSNKLSLAATRMGLMAGGPFDQVIGMIKKLTLELEEEAQVEAQEHAACETMKKDNKEDLDNSKSILDGDKATRDGLQTTISDTQDEIADTTDAKKQTEERRRADIDQRNRDSTENKRIIRESAEAEEALTNAVQLVSDFFGSADSNEDATKSASEGIKGIFAMIQQMKQDSSSTKSETTTAESFESGEHADMLDNVKISLSNLAQQLSNARLKLEDSKLELNNTVERIESESANYKSYLAETDSINKQCTPQVSHEERMAGRETEMKYLQEALDALNRVD